MAKIELNSQIFLNSFGKYQKLVKFLSYRYQHPINSTYLFFNMQLHFFTSSSTCLRSHDFSKKCSAVAYSTTFIQPLVSQELLIFNKFVLPWFTLIGGKAYSFSLFLSRFVMLQQTVAEFWRKFSFFMISANRSVNFKMALLFYKKLSLVNYQIMWIDFQK